MVEKQIAAVERKRSKWLKNRPQLVEGGEKKGRALQVDKNRPQLVERRKKSRIAGG